MVALATTVAILMYLLPVAVVFLWRAERTRKLWEVALDIPLAVAVDLLLIQLLARFTVLENAILVTRGLWAAGLLAAAAQRIRARRRHGKSQSIGEWVRWPESLRRWDVITGAAAAIAGGLLSAEFSRRCQGYDRSWHIPLTSSLRGQTLPFENVYAPGKPLAYHLTGDLVGGSVQVLSGNVLHSSLALAVGHDILYGLSALSIALLLRWFGFTRVVPTMLASLTPLLAGPLTLWVEAGRRGAGHNFINFMKISFRPHVVVAGLMMVGFIGMVLVRLREDRAETSSPPDAKYTAVVLAVTTALLSITDEPSVGLLGLALGVTWLFNPDVLDPRRVVGMGVLLLLLGSVVGANALYNGAMFAGLETSIEWVPARAPGYFRPPLPIDHETAWRTLKWDLLPTLTFALGGMLVLLRRPRRKIASTVVFYTALLALGVLGLIHIDVGQRSVESHRFMTAPMFAGPLLASFWIAAPVRHARFELAGAVLVGMMALSSICSVDWLRRTTSELKPAGTCHQPKFFLTEFQFLELNCRELVDARWGIRPRPVWMERPAAYLYSGCRPVYMAGPKLAPVQSDRLDLESPGVVPNWDTQIGRAIFGWAALLEVHQNQIPAGQPLETVCLHDSKNPICRAAKKLGVCRDVGTAILSCVVAANKRQALVRSKRK